MTSLDRDGPTPPIYHRRRRGSQRNATYAGRPATIFWILIGYLSLLFVAGGSSVQDTPLLPLVRLSAVLLAGYGAMTLPRERWRAYRWPISVAGAVFLLTLLHLIPMPPALWRANFSADSLRFLDGVGLGADWRPISLAPSRTVNALFFLFVPFATLLLAIRLPDGDRVRLLHAILLLGGASAILGLFQSTGLPLSLYHVGRADGRVDAAGVFANQNHQAAMLAILLPVLAVAVRYRQPRGSARLAGILAACFAVAIVILLIVTGSRAGLVLGIVAIAMTLFFGLLKVDWLDTLSSPRATLVKVAFGLILIAGAATVTVITSRDLAFSRLALAHEDLRPKLWASIVPALPHYQPWGSGIGSYVEAYRVVEPMKLLRNTYSNHAHNEYLEVLMTAGIPGMVLLLVAVLLVAGTAVRHRGGSGDSLQARLGITIIVILAIASLTDYPLRTPLLAAVLSLAVMWSGPSPRRT